MALVVFLKGINVGGHRTFRPNTVAKRLKRFGATNMGAAGTFIIRRPVGRAPLRQAIQRLMPFEVAIIICEGRDILELASQDPFAGQRSSRRDLVQFVSVQARRQQARCAPPFTVPATGRWCVSVLAHYKRFVIGMHRREMQAIKHIGQLEKLVGGPMTTRSWSTILTLARLLGAPSSGSRHRGGDHTLLSASLVAQFGSPAGARTFCAAQKWKRPKRKTPK